MCIASCSSSSLGELDLTVTQVLATALNAGQTGRSPTRMGRVEPGRKAESSASAGRLRTRALRLPLGRTLGGGRFQLGHPRTEIGGELDELQVESNVAKEPIRAMLTGARTYELVPGKPEIASATAVLRPEHRPSALALLGSPTQRRAQCIWALRSKVAALRRSFGFPVLPFREVAPGQSGQYPVSLISETRAADRSSRATQEEASQSEYLGQLDRLSNVLQSDGPDFVEAHVWSSRPGSGYPSGDE